MREGKTVNMESGASFRVFVTSGRSLSTRLKFTSESCLFVCLFVGDYSGSIIITTLCNIIRWLNGFKVK